MSRPVLFVIDDDPGVVRALHGDLSRRFGEDFRVAGASSAAAGLATLRELAAGHETVALLIADHRMPEMPGVDFLRSAHALHPLAKRVLLVERDYSTSSPAGRVEQAWMFGAHMVFSQPATGQAQDDDQRRAPRRWQPIVTRTVIVAPGASPAAWACRGLEAGRQRGTAMEGRDVFVVRELGRPGHTDPEGSSLPAMSSPLSGGPRISAYASRRSPAGPDPIIDDLTSVTIGGYRPTRFVDRAGVGSTTV